jgi:hypothetical protein
MRDCSCGFLLLCLVLFQSCGASKKLSEGHAKQKIRELGLVEFKDKQIEIQKIFQSGDNQAVAEATVALAFRLSRAKDQDWHVSAIRLGDRDWVETKAFLLALDEVRARETRDRLLRLQEGIRKYREKTGNLPDGSTMATLTDALFPNYLPEPIRYDAWNHEFTLRITAGSSYQIISAGSDGIPGTADDISLGPSL